MNQERMLTIIRHQYISEKTTIIANKLKQFTFIVLNTATKNEVKAAVEQLFKVKVKNVSILNMQGKVKKFRNSVGKRKDFKKAYVALHDGYDINFSDILRHSFTESRVCQENQAKRARNQRSGS